VRVLAGLFRPDRARILAAVLVYTVKHSPNWLLPLVTAEILDTVVQHRPVVRLWLCAGAIVVMLALNPPLHLVYVRLFSGSTRRVATALRAALCHRVQELSLGYHARVSDGVLQAKVVRDVETIEQMAQQAADNGLGALTVLLGGMTVIAVRTPAFLPAFLVVVPAAGLLVTRLWQRMGAHNESYRHEVEHLSSGVAEMAHLLPITRAHGLERRALERMDGVLGRVLAAGLRLDLLNGRFGSLSWSLLNLLGVGFLTGTALVAYYGLVPVTAGDVVMLSTSVAVLTPNATALMVLAPVVSKGLESVRSIGELLRAPVERNTGRTEVRAVRGAVEFRGVGYRYGTGEHEAVRDFTLDVAPGETVALVGASGAGKSTVLKLVIGLVRPTGGQLLLDGADMESLDLRTYRRFVSLVPQEPVFFDGTVRENVAYGLDDTGDAAVRTALRDAHALEFVDRLPHGLHTRIGERGARLSGGQKQRLAIARALIRDPRVLVLDEATSSLDTHSEALVQQALARLVRGRTTFVVAHRLSTVRGADRIVVMRDGAIVEIGTHEDLVRRGAAYTLLQAAQLT
jgi:ATP-binding cassette, subfamily B, bacterial